MILPGEMVPKCRIPFTEATNASTNGCNAQKEEKNFAFISCFTKITYICEMIVVI